MSRTAVVIVTPDVNGVAAMVWAKRNFEVIHALYLTTENASDDHPMFEMAQGLHTATDTFIADLDLPNINPIMADVLRLMIGADLVAKQTSPVHGIVTGSTFNNLPTATVHDIVSPVWNIIYNVYYGHGETHPPNRTLIHAPMSGMDVVAWLKDNAPEVYKKLQPGWRQLRPGTNESTANGSIPANTSPDDDKTPVMDAVTETLPTTETVEENKPKRKKEPVGE